MMLLTACKRSPVRRERPDSHFTPNPTSIRYENEVHVGTSATDDKDLRIKKRRSSILFCNFTKNRPQVLQFTSWFQKCHLPNCNVPFIITLFFFLQRTYQNDDFFTSSEDSLLGRHRNRVAISATSFIGGSTDSTIANIHKHHNYNKCSNSRMSASTQKELNILITTPEVPELSTGNDTSKHKVTVQEPSIQENNQVGGIICEDTCSCKNNADKSVRSKAEIRWVPQVSSC